ncbi:hypothetical protein FRACYDRAFT_250929 [Fragilariopsis cylindrus CCMP1102]|uniref:Uncharacterized protein n=1 Tax=Fragilariopsis cylindrus CCMP1102 TaxID=635003 RepID=A0A1E7ENH5_9STRA|nr:hypothetical protein FRACYDRAFT_250929 [Fragilariopsis cylindrus CCMP1102]|eukprot:OEU07508.1 hypothetical protein FRACYDRAFT_250929 [Fragilariopsis cylindrus CCMP1102]
MIDYMNQPQVQSNIRTQTRSQFSLKPKRLAKIRGRGGIGKPTVSTDRSHDRNFYPIDDPSYQNITWYDAISPYWTGDMVWNSAYVLNHQVVSVTTRPIFVSDLLPAFEMSATIHTPKAKSGGENVGPRATIALDIRDLRGSLACPSDLDLANAIEHNVTGNNPSTRRDVCIAKKI